MQQSSLVNGAFKKSIAITDRGLHYGDGVWETLIVQLTSTQNNNPSGQITQHCKKDILCETQFFSAHYQRLQYGCQALGITPPDAKTLIREIRLLCRELLSTNRPVVLKIILTRGSGGRGYRPEQRPDDQSATRILSLHPLLEHVKRCQKNGIQLQFNQTRLSVNPQLARFKHLNRLEQVLGSRELGDSVEEGLMSDTNGNIVEGTMSNLFVVTQKGRILTPEIRDCGIEGVMRNEVIRWLSNQPINQDAVVETVKMTAEDVQKARHLFMTNSVIGIWPVKTLITGNATGQNERLELQRAPFVDEFNQQFQSRFEPLSEHIPTGGW